MGVNLNVVTKRLADHPQWDNARYAGDRDFVTLELEKQVHDVDRDMQLWRPADFTVWRAATVDFPNPDRFRQLLDLLEADPDYWVYASW